MPRPLNDATRLGVLPSVRAPGPARRRLRRTWGPRRLAASPVREGMPSQGGVAASVALVRRCPFPQLATRLRETRKGCAARPHWCAIVREVRGENVTFLPRASQLLREGASPDRQPGKGAAHVE